MPIDSHITRRRFLQASALAGAGLAGYGVWRYASPSSHAKGKIVIIGGGSAGLNIAARLHRTLAQPDITIVDPAEDHYYQPGFTLVAAGVFSPQEVVRREETLMPAGVRWVRDSVKTIDAAQNRLETAHSGALHYDFLVLCPGLEMHFDQIEGLDRNRLGEGNVHCIYDFQGAQRCWRAIEALARTGGRAYFTDTWTKLKCGGAPKKINMLTEDYCRRQGARDRVDIRLFSASHHMFDEQPFARRLEQIYAERHIPAVFNHRIKAVDTAARKVTFERRGKEAPTGDFVTVDYDFLHVVPPMSAPAFVKDSDLAFDPKTGKHADWVPADPATLIHPRYKNVCVVGDVAGLPTSKTGAAIRMQAPVAAANLIALMEGRAPQARYNGYTACPLITEYGKVLMAEFDYTKQPRPTMPLLDPGREHRAGWLLKRYVIRPAYFDLMLAGLA